MRMMSVGELRGSLASVLDAVEAGGRVTVTRHGRPVAVIMPLGNEYPPANEGAGDLAGAELVGEPGAIYAGRSVGQSGSQPVTAFVGGVGDRLFSSRAARKVLSLFVLHPNREFYQREVARRSGVPLRSAQLALERLVSLGLVDSARSGNQVHYSAVPSAAFDALRAWAIPEVALVPVLREALEPLGEAIEMAFVYGSTATGEDTAASDIDLMVVGEGDTYDVIEALEPARQGAGREINVSRYSPAEFRQKLAEGSHFVTTVMKSPVLWVIGEGGANHDS